MREAIAYHLFSGQAWFTSGAVLIAIAVADLTPLLARHRRLAAAARVTGLAACATAALSGTPLPLWLAIVAAAALAAFFLVTIGSSTMARRAGAGAVLVVVTGAVAAEVPFHAAAPARGGSSRPIIVIGDSLSSGGFGEVEPWPELISRSHHLTNLSQPSETVALALRDAAPTLFDAAPGSVVILEIGGNDMLDKTPVDEFERDLAKLVSAARGAAGGRRDVVMFELPLLPGAWAWGAAQRRVARSQGVVLIPKRVLARILTRRSNTSDGLHLTQKGHDELARETARWIP